MFQPRSTYHIHKYELENSMYGPEMGEVHSCCLTELPFQPILVKIKRSRNTY